MKFSKFILAVASSFLILSQAGAATIVGNLMDIYGGGIDRTIKISPKSTPQAVVYNGTNYTVMDLAKTVSSTNSVFSVVLLGGIYNVDFGTVNGVATPVTKILVPPYDTNTYSFNYVANLATNLGTFVWTNTYGIAAGTNIVIQTNGALLVINASIAATPTPTNFSSITVTNDINRGSTSDTGKSLNISLGGLAATSPGTGGNGGTVNIASGVNGNGLTGLGGDGGTVTIAQGGTSGANAVSGGNGGTVNIANASSKGIGGTVNIATNGSTYVGGLIVNSNQTILGSIFATNSSQTIKAKLDYAGLTLDKSDDAFSFVANPYGMTFYSDNLGGSPSLSYDNTSGNGLLTLAGTVHSAYSEIGAAYLNGYTGSAILGIVGNGVDNTLEVDYPHFIVGADHSVTANGASFNADNTTVFSSNVYFAKNIYVTNHSYDASGSLLDPESNEYVTATFVRSVLNNGAFLYGTTNTTAVGFSNIVNNATNSVSLQFGANAPLGYIKGFTNFATGTYTNGPYFASIISSNTYQAVTGPFVNDFYIAAGGSSQPAISITPDIFVTYNKTNLIPLCEGAGQALSVDGTTNLYTWIQSAAQYNSTNTAGFYIVRRVRVVSQNGNNLFINVLGGNGYATSMSFNTPVTVNANYSGTFIGNGSGLTNIPATGIVGTAVTNNANPTFTGLSVGAQTALDVNGNGKVGGVGHTNGVLTGNGGGITNVMADNGINKVPFQLPMGASGGAGMDAAMFNALKVPPNQGPSQYAYIHANTGSFGNSTNTKMVYAMQYWATNGTSLSLNHVSVFLSNNIVKTIQPPTQTVPITASNAVWVYVTNNIGNITNISQFSFGPYNNGTTTFWTFPASGYAFLIP